ncbi:MAG: nicotinate-nucleotide diphosphorylase (carboxylating) [Lysobacterales bacterium CG_4_9_14_3_um_filter_62_6]|nr:MAG: nicotinate-nucleotide diphosphorylase (carboxylating) [Xanthomonadales bacterium CG_4_9_14_3_um_filter_62_6]
MTEPVAPAAAVVQGDVARALEEDLGAIDLTAQLLPAWAEASAQIIVREAAVLCGSDWAAAAFHSLDPELQMHWHYRDGDRLVANCCVLDLCGKVRAIVSAERTALNFLQTLSATATVARRYADAVVGTGTRVLDTRKTLPGLRAAQKYAVRCGGASNHRLGLYDAVLIKENHIRAAGSISAAISAARTIAGQRLVEIEVETLAEFAQALAAAPDRMLLDDWSLVDMRQAVADNAGRVALEISGGVDLDRLQALAALGVDYLSVGALTKHLRAIDFSLRLL